MTQAILIPAPAPAPAGAAPAECIALGSTTHGRWVYSTVILYRAGTRADGTRIWKRESVVAEHRSTAKAARVAELEAADRGCPFIPTARHGQEIAA